MAHWTQPLPTNIASVVTYDEAANACWLADASGSIVSFRFLRRQVLKAGDGWNDVVIVSTTGDGVSLLVARLRVTVIRENEFHLS